jgi:hypothetical protein
MIILFYNYDKETFATFEGTIEDYINLDRTLISDFIHTKKDILQKVDKKFILGIFDNMIDVYNFVYMEYGMKYKIV